MPRLKSRDAWFDAIGIFGVAARGAAQWSIVRVTGFETLPGTTRGAAGPLLAWVDPCPWALRPDVGFARSRAIPPVGYVHVGPFADERDARSYLAATPPPPRRRAIYLRRLVFLPAYLFGTGILFPRAPWYGWVLGPYVVRAAVFDPTPLAMSIAAAVLTVTSILVPSVRWAFILALVYLLWIVASWMVVVAGV